MIGSVISIRFVRCAAALALLAGCPKSGGGDVGAVDAGTLAVAPVDAGALAVADAQAAPTGSALDPALSIPERFAREAASRPSGTPKVEDVTAAFTKAGVTLNEVKQHLASPIGARYCVGATTEAGVSMSMCEYADEAAAKAGRDASAKAFAAIKNRDIYINKTTTLTLLLAPKTPASDAQAKKLIATFGALK